MREENEVDGKKRQTHNDDSGCKMSFIPKRYIVTILATFGLFNTYTLRVDLSVPIVAMVNNVTTFTHGHDVKTQVCNFSFDQIREMACPANQFYKYYTAGGAKNVPPLFVVALKPPKEAILFQ